MSCFQAAAPEVALPGGTHSALAFVRLLLCLLLAGLSLGIKPSAAEEIRRLTLDGFPLDEPIRFRIRGTLLQVPAGYIASWPTRKMRNIINEQDGISFNFWMPDRRYVEISNTSLTDFQPKEPGRYQSSSTTFIFKVDSLRLMKPEELGVRSPEMRFKNLTSTPGPASYSFKQEEFGLVRFWRNDWPHPQPEPFLNYKHVEGTDPQILLECTPPHRTPANPICRGYLYSAADELSLSVTFARKDLPQWRESVRAAIELFKSWKTAAQ